MTNWKEYTITKVGDQHRTIWICFYLDGYVNYKSNGSERWKRKNFIFCKNTYPFSTYRVGDVIEIDLDKTQNKWDGDDIDDTSIIRVARVAPSSTNVITTRGSSSNIVILPSAVNAVGSPQAMEFSSAYVSNGRRNWKGVWI